MPDYKGVLKDGWHPSWDQKLTKDNLKNPRSWMGKGNNDATSRAQSHQSTPLSSLRDPASFAPPPKHINYHGAEAASASLSNPSSPAAIAPAPPAKRYDTDTGGLGGPISRTTLEQQQQAQQQAQAEVEKPRAPPTPYRVNTTGLSTDGLPPPPRRATGSPAGASASPAVPARSSTGMNLTKPPTPATAPRPQPKLPPRLPQRQNSNPHEFSAAPPPPYREAAQTSSHVPQSPSSPSKFPNPSGNLSTNTSSLNNLGRAGVSVPGFGINTSTSHPQGPPSPVRTPGGMSELQNRFSSMSASGGSNPAPPTPVTASSVGSTFNTFKKAQADPSKVSFSEARDAAKTANAVNQRYGAQIGAGLKAANGFANQQGAGGGQAEGNASPGGSVAGRVAGLGGLANAAAAKKPPPPVPPHSRASAAQDGGANGGAPPPVPMGSKPRF